MSFIIQIDQSLPSAELSYLRKLIEVGGAEGIILGEYPVIDYVGEYRGVEYEVADETFAFIVESIEREQLDEAAIAEMVVPASQPMLVAA